MTRRVVIAIAAGALLASATPVAALAQTADEGAVPASIEELSDLTVQAWNEKDHDLLEQVYAPDAVHRVVYYDRTQTYEGIDAIAKVATYPYSSVTPLGDNIEIGAPEGEIRWAMVAHAGSNTACLFAAVEGRITRQDCLVASNSNGTDVSLPETSRGSNLSADQLSQLGLDAWNDGDAAAFEEAYAPHAVHTATFRDLTRRYEDRDAFAPIVMLGRGMEILGERIDLEADAGEIQWASLSDLGGGTLCMIRAKGDQIVRHDCLVPTAS